MLLAQKHKIITMSQLTTLTFAKELLAVCTKQNLGKEHSMLPYVTTHSSFAKSVMVSVTGVHLKTAGYCRTPQQHISTAAAQNPQFHFPTAQR